MFRQDADGRDVELADSTVALEVEPAAGRGPAWSRCWASVSWHRGRIDTLGLDENGSPVVIEFKKGSDSGVLS